MMVLDRISNGMFDIATWWLGENVLISFNETVKSLLLPPSF